jgi:hypothetical protein
MTAVANSGRLDALRQALEALDDGHELDRPALDRILTTTIGVLHRELEAARERRTRLRLFGDPA